MNNKRIIYWREYPMDCETGLYEELHNYFNNEIIFLCNNDLSEERKTVGFDYLSIKNSKTIIIDDEDKVINEYMDDIHIFNGITGTNGKHLRKLLKTNKNAKFFIVAERPDIYGNFVQKIWRMSTRFVYYRLFSFIYTHLYKNNFLGLLAMGDKAVQTYKLLGFKEKFLFDYMYTLRETKKIKFNKTGDIVNFLYIGRFDDSTKGLDILRSAFDELDYDNYKLDLVGGYGVDADKTINWAKDKKNISYIGKWSYDEVIQNMNNYDICLVPSKYDGWNLAPNQVIDAGIGIIISDNATSDELVRFAKNGLFFKNSNKKEFINCLKKVLDNKKLIDKYKKNSLLFKKKISNKLLCQYYLNIIEYCMNGYKGNKPVPSWKK